MSGATFPAASSIARSPNCTNATAASSAVAISSTKYSTVLNARATTATTPGSSTPSHHNASHVTTPDSGARGDLNQQEAFNLPRNLIEDIDRNLLAI